MHFYTILQIYNHITQKCERVILKSKILLLMWESHYITYITIFFFFVL